MLSSSLIILFFYKEASTCQILSFIGASKCLGLLYLLKQHLYGYHYIWSWIKEINWKFVFLACNLLFQLSHLTSVLPDLPILEPFWVCTIGTWFWFPLGQWDLPLCSFTNFIFRLLRKPHVLAHELSQFSIWLVISDFQGS